MTKHLYCTRCGEPQGHITQGELKPTAHIVCNQCDDQHISNDVKAFTVSNLSDVTHVKERKGYSK